MQPIPILMIVFSIVLFIVSLLVGNGETGLIRSFDWTNVKDKKAYAKFLGKSIAKIAYVIFLSGVVGLLVGTKTAVILFVVLFIVQMVFITKKSNEHYQ